MSTSPTASLLRHLRQWAAGPGDAPHSDRELLWRFATQREEAAFATLVRRHGPMVLSVCRRILPQASDAEDAFQATFLVLLRRAATHSWHESIGGWLHGVATRIALRQRAASARRAVAVPRAEESSIADPLEQVTARELLAAFDEELARLPQRYRAPLVLCCLQGKTQEETARLLDSSLSTIRRRLERGRRLLHTRLTRRGLELSTALGAVLLSREASAVVPPLLRASVLQLSHGSVSGRVAALAESAMHAAGLTPMKATAAVVLLLGVLAAGAGWAASHFVMMNAPETDTAANAAPETPTTEKAERTDRYGDPLPPGALLRMGTVRFRNREFIGSVAFSPDGKILAAGGYPGMILLYDMATGRKLREIKAATSQIPSLTFAPDGKTLASADLQTIQTWDLATSKEIRRFDSGVKDFSYRDYGVSCAPLVFSRDGKELACPDHDHSIRIWDAATGKELAKLAHSLGPIRCLAFSSDRKTLYAAGDHSVQVWDISTSKEVRTFSLQRQRGRGSEKALCFSPDGNTLVFSAFATEQRKQGNARLNLVGERISFLDMNTGKSLPMFELQEGRFKSGVFSPDGKLLATMSTVPTTIGNLRSEASNRIQVWETATGKRLLDLTTDAERFGLHGPHLLAFTTEGKKLTAATWATSLHIWDLDRGREHLEKPDAHTDLVQCVAYSPDGRTLATASSDYSIALWDAATGRMQNRLRGHQGPVISIAFSPDGKRLASASTQPDQSVRLWDLATGKQLQHYLVPLVANGDGTFSGVTTHVAFTAKGKILAATGTDRRFRLWDATTGKEIRDEPIRGLHVPSGIPNQWPNHVADLTHTPDGRMMALYAAQVLSVVDTVAGQTLYQFETEANRATTILALSPDGKTLLRGVDKSVYLLEAASGAALHKTKLPENVFGAAFSPDGRVIAVSTDENNARIHLLDMATGEELLCLSGHESRVRSLTFSPDGTKLASGQWDSTAVIWDISAARRKLPSNDLTPRDLERLWTHLRDADAAKAHTALWTLVAAADKAVSFLKEWLHPVPRVAAERLNRLIADLDAEEFARREEASRELTKLGSEAEAALRKVLEGKPSLELRRRVEGLLNDMKCQTEMTPEALRQLRAIGVLEQIGSPEARQILMSLAQGAPAAPVTRDAAAALQRLCRD